MFSWLARKKPNPCVLCGNDFIEIFGDDTTRWWCGCKPCSKRDGGRDHVTGFTRKDAITRWNEVNPIRS